MPPPEPMTTEFQKIKKELEELQKHQELILQSAGEGIYGLDNKGHTTFVNRAAAEMVGWELEELVGKSQHAAIHHTKPDGDPYDASK